MYYMNTEEKFKAIMESMPAIPRDFTPLYLSFIVITGYLDELEKQGFIVSAHAVTDTGRSVIATCQEFDWTPTDIDIDMYVEAFVPPDSQGGIKFFLKEYRDNPDSLLEKLEKIKRGEV